MASLLPMLAMALALLANYHCQAIEEPRKLYIVFVDPSLPSGDEAYLQILAKVLVGCTPAESLVYKYSKEFSAFAAKLTDSEAKKLERLDGILGVQPSGIYYPTLSPPRPWKLSPEIPSSPAPIERNLI